MEQAQSFQQRMARIEGLIAEVEASRDAAAADASRSLVRAILEMHAAGFARVLELAPEKKGAFAADDLVGSLLLLHEVHPQSFEERIAAAIAKSSLEMGAHGAAADLIGVSEGVVKVRIRRTAAGRAGIAALRQIVEENMLAQVPDAAGVDIEAPDDDGVGFVPLEKLGKHT